MKFIVTGILHLGVYTEVEAETEDQALQIAGERSVRPLCPQCSAANDGEGRERFCLGETVLVNDVNELSVELAK